MSCHIPVTDVLALNKERQRRASKPGEPTYGAVRLDVRRQPGVTTWFISKCIGSV
jgi:hypothetical protein